MENLEFLNKAQDSAAFLEKAKDISKLQKKIITDKKGRQKTVWVKTGEDKTPDKPQRSEKEQGELDWKIIKVIDSQDSKSSKAKKLAELGMETRDIAKKLDMHYSHAHSAVKGVEKKGQAPKEEENPQREELDGFYGLLTSNDESNQALAKALFNNVKNNPEILSLKGLEFSYQQKTGKTKSVVFDGTFASLQNLLSKHAEVVVTDQSNKHFAEKIKKIPVNEISFREIKNITIEGYHAQKLFVFSCGRVKVDNNSSKTLSVRNFDELNITSESQSSNLHLYVDGKGSIKIDSPAIKTLRILMDTVGQKISTKDALASIPNLVNSNIEYVDVWRNTNPSEISDAIKFKMPKAARIE